MRKSQNVRLMQVTTIHLSCNRLQRSQEKKTMTIYYIMSFPRQQLRLNTGLHSPDTSSTYPQVIKLSDETWTRKRIAFASPFRLVKMSTHQMMVDLSLRKRNLMTSFPWSTKNARVSQSKCQTILFYNQNQCPVGHFLLVKTTGNLSMKIMC